MIIILWLLIIQLISALCVALFFRKVHPFLDGFIIGITHTPFVWIGILYWWIKGDVK